MSDIQQEWSWCEKCGHCTHLVRLKRPEGVSPFAHFITAAICFVINRTSQGVTPGEAAVELFTTGGMALEYAASVPAHVRVGAC